MIFLGVCSSQEIFLRPSPPFADAFRTFRSDGEYQCYVSHDGARHYYRFLAPRESGYPPKLELLSRSILPEPAGHPFTPLPVDGAARSMSAIVLDPVYYRFAVKERELVDGMPCLSKLGLIALKACAYLNLSAEHAKDPASVRGDDIRKHRNDVFRMLAAVEPSDRIEPPPQIANCNAHIESFIKTFKTECLDHLILTDERQLQYVVREFLEYYNHERCHSGLDGRRIDPRPEPPDGEIRLFTRLGGLLKCYRRVVPGSPGGIPVNESPPVPASA